ncbi:protein kinase [Lentinula raphanica]|nr:protein kinase [Lentinula raphanica]
MEQSPGNDPSANSSNDLATPAENQHASDAPPVQSTPSQSQGYDSDDDDDASWQPLSILDELMDADVNDKLVLNLDDFATLMLDLPSDWKVSEKLELSPESKEVKDAFEAYLAVAAEALNEEGKTRKSARMQEKALFQPLEKILKTLKDAKGQKRGIDEKAFHTQDPRPILESLLERYPNFGGIYRQLSYLAGNYVLSTFLQETQTTGVFWGLLLYFLDVKHETLSRSIQARLNKRKATDDEEEHTGARPAKKMKSRLEPTTQLRRRSARIAKGAELRSTSSSSDAQSTSQANTVSCAKSNQTPSADTVSAPDAPSPASTSASVPAKRAELAQVTIHQKEDNDTTLEVGNVEEYEQKDQIQLGDADKLTSTDGQRPGYRSYAKGIISSELPGVTDSNALRSQCDDSKIVESQASDYSSSSCGVFTRSSRAWSARGKYFFPTHTKIDEEWKKLFIAMVSQLNKIAPEYPESVSETDDFLDVKRLAYACMDEEDELDDLVGTTYSFRSSGRMQAFVIRKFVHRSHGNLMNGGSAVFEANCVCNESDCKWHGEKKILKVTFSSHPRPSEENGIIDEARLKAESTGDSWALNHLPDIVETITLYYREYTVQGCRKRGLCVMHITVLEELRPLLKLEAQRDVAQVFYDILQIHQWLYECAGILHRDISSGNVMYRKIDGKIYGVLNDFDLACRIQDLAKRPIFYRRVGTIPFMSFDLLNPKWDGLHYPRHDLESLFYVMFCMAYRNERPGICASEPRAYERWYYGTSDQVWDSKMMFLYKINQRHRIQPYFATFEPWLDSIYESISLGYKVWTQWQHLKVVDSVADLTTLDGRVTYSNMRSIMSSFEDQLLETRWEPSR